MEKFSFNLFIFAAILIIASHSTMMVEARGPIVLFGCNKVEDCGRFCAKCAHCKCINHFCTCLSNPPPFP
uniref:Uncharacterized protein n=1 Tax=Gossypium raimondii TaxID=29730 RepID=A0A0D2SXM9_GOSRA|nr:hypothetical protein B456_008G092400 [Gossypium raimondii]